MSRSLRAAGAGASAVGSSAALSDLDILSFALSLEHLEHTFYTRIVEADTQRQFLHGRLHEIAPVLRDNEAAHIEAISTAITALGGTPAPAGTYKFPTNVFISPISFAHFAYTLEDIGVGAYLGAVGKIKSKDIRRAAASIYGSETRHAALLRHLGGFQFSPRYYEGPLTVAQTQQLIDPYVV